ncbi:MAG TPA: two-component regulator propeller domain-containing protein [Phnomibacter sp.]|nr:two-component regulator propeller domain-containing protein [Phnomibacter sp.]
MLAGGIGKAHAQKNINFITLNTSRGLSSNNVIDILKDSYGQMWIATDDGLNRYDGTKFTHYRGRIGDTASLQSNEILKLYEDGKGNLWIGTGGGALSLYDRKRDVFRHFIAGEQPEQILHNVVYAITTDFTGRLWVGTYAGINLLDPETLKITQLNNTQGARLTGAIRCLFEDSRKTMWIGTVNGLYAYEPSTHNLVRYDYDAANPAGIGGRQVNSIVEDDFGRLWFGTENGLSMLRAGAREFIQQPVNGAGVHNGGKVRINSLSFDDDGELWQATNEGIGILNVRSGMLKSIAYDKRDIQGLASRRINKVYNDKAGIMWLGTERGGINKYDKNLVLFNLIQSQPFDTDGLPSALVNAFAEGADGSIYVGTEYGGVSKFDIAHKTFERVPVQPLQTHNKDGLVVLSMCFTSNQKLLVGTYRDGLLIYDPQTKATKQLFFGTDFESREVFCVTEDSKGNYWVGLNGKGFVILGKNYEIKAWYNPGSTDSSLKLPANGYTRDIIEDSNGIFWIATHGGGMYRFDYNRRQFTVYNQQQHGLPADKIRTLLEDGKGRIWVGTFGGGLAVLNTETSRFETFSEKDGLSNGNVYKILEDKAGNLWLSTNAGISRFDIKEQKFQNFGLYNGVQEGQFSRGAGMRTRNGMMFFGGSNGFNYFLSENLPQNVKAPPVVFTDLRVSNELVTPSAKGPIVENMLVAKEIRLAYKQNFSIGFVGVNYTAAEQNQYAYKLEGYDRDWNYLGNTHTISFTNLSPGHYVLHVKASNNDGVWNQEGKRIEIFVEPPFWRTTYAYAAYILVVGGVLFLMRKRGIQKVKARYEQEQERMRYEQERREAERTTELERQKIKFLTNLSHEFRTPISLIQGPVDSLLQAEHNEQHFSKLQMIKRNMRRLLNLVNQLLDFRKLEGQELLLQMSEGDFVEFVYETIDSFRDLADRKHIHLVFDNQLSSLPARFDQNKLERILFNLLSNAFKFTLEGGTITVRLTQLAEKSVDSIAWVQLEVTDTGIGISPEHQDKVFETFFQAMPTSGILNQGSGIGLAITKEFVRLHGGTIRVKSDLGKGACFTIQLPLEKITHLVAQQADMDTTEVYAQAKGAQNSQVADKEGLQDDLHTLPAILIVEDNDDFRHFLREGLTPYFRVYEASNGKEGWQRALADHPQLVISDISMPFMNGIELCRKIKTDKRTSHIAVILLTALTGEEQELKGLEIGANDYITKPFNFELLIAKVKNLLSLNQTFKNTYSRQIRVQAAEVVVESEDEKLMKEVMSYIDENLTDPNLSVEGLSRHLGKSRSSLYTRLLELTGQTPVEFIRGVKLERAAQLLEKSDMNIAQVAYSAGFATPNYFTKSFKAKYNMLPSEYASKMKGKASKSSTDS